MSAAVGSPRPGRLRARGRLAERARAVGSLRAADAFLGLLLVIELEIPGTNIPVNVAVLLAIIVLALSRRATRAVPDLRWFVPLMVIALSYLAIISMITVQDDYALDWRRRLLRLALVVIALCLIPAGRIDLRSLIVGFATGLVVNIPLWAVLGIGAENYVGNLTGLLGDKNVAGLAYAVGIFAVLAVVRDRSTRVLVVGALAVGLWLTGSRASIAACVAGFVWMLLAPKVPVVVRWVLGVCIYGAIQLVTEDFSQVGRFSDRVGSDLLRERIDRASVIAVDHAGFFGKGLGQAIALVNGSGWFFHNSYWTALVEGGWPWLAVILGVTGLLILRPFSNAPMDRSEPVIQAAAVVLLVCATRLGEVFFTTYWMLVIALELHRRSIAGEPDDVVRPGLRRTADTSTS